MGKMITKFKNIKVQRKGSELKNLIGSLAAGEASRDEENDIQQINFEQGKAKGCFKTCKVQGYLNCHPQDLFCQTEELKQVFTQQNPENERGENALTQGFCARLCFIHLLTK